MAGDLSWVRDIGISTRREGGAIAGHDWAMLSFPETSIHHESRCLWRLVVFAKGWREPLFSVDLERDILGEFCLSVLEGKSHRILERYGSAPAYPAFRRRALEEARDYLAMPPHPGVEPAVDPTAAPGSLPLR